MEKLHDYYESLDDEKLQRIAVYEAKDLTSEAVDALIDVLFDRGFNETLINNVHLQRESLSDNDIHHLVGEFATTECPYCGKPGRINAIKVTEVVSFILFTDVQKKVAVGCQECLGQILWKAIDKTSLWGWWGLPSGILETPKALSSNRANFVILNESFETPSDVFIEYVKSNIGYVMNYLSYKH